MTGLPGGSASFIAVSILAFVILGSVLEGIPAIVLFGPLLFPIARAVGVHEVHYAWASDCSRHRSEWAIMRPAPSDASIRPKA
jgi:hypothetical protein